MNILKKSTLEKFLLFLILLIFMHFFINFILKIWINNNSNGNSVNKTARLTVSIKNNTLDSIDSMYLSSNYEDKINKIDSIPSNKEITGEFEISYKLEGSAILVYIDKNNIEHKKVIVGYLMPQNEVSLEINKADTENFEVKIKTSNNN